MPKKTLYEILQENQLKKDEEFAAKVKENFKPPKALDEDEMAFFDEVFDHGVLVAEVCSDGVAD